MDASDRAPRKSAPSSSTRSVAAGDTVLGTSHRQPPVKNLVGSVRSGLTELFSLPDGWEIVLGNGGSTVFWDVATFGLISNRSQHLVFGEFSSKFAEAAAVAPHLGEPTVVKSNTGSHPDTVAEDGIDLYALTHNETSTGVAMELRRPAGTSADTALVAVDATSAAGGTALGSGRGRRLLLRPTEVLRLRRRTVARGVLPAALDRIRSIGASDRWRPASLDLQIALDNSVQNQTYNTPALATLVMLDAQIRWMLDNGGMDFAAGRSAESAAILYGWAEARDWANPFVADPSMRSNVVGTIDLDDSIDATTINKSSHANGVLDTFAYRKLGRNQLRIAMFPAIDPSDVEALTHSIDHVVAATDLTLRLDRRGCDGGSRVRHRRHRRARAPGDARWPRGMVRRGERRDAGGQRIHQRGPRRHRRIDRSRPVLRLHATASPRVDRRRHPRDRVAEQRVRPPTQPRAIATSSA